MADTSVVDLDSDLVGFGRGDLDILDAQVLAGLPGDGGLTGDCLVKLVSGIERRRAGVKTERGCRELMRGNSQCSEELTLPAVSAMVCDVVVMNR